MYFDQPEHVIIHKSHKVVPHVRGQLAFYSLCINKYLASNSRIFAVLAFLRNRSYLSLHSSVLFHFIVTNQFFYHFSCVLDFLKGRIFFGAEERTSCIKTFSLYCFLQKEIFTILGWKISRA